MLNNRYKNDLNEEGKQGMFVPLTNHWLKTRRLLIIKCCIRRVMPVRVPTSLDFTIDVPLVLTFSAKVFYPTQFVVVFPRILKLSLICIHFRIQSCLTCELYPK